MEDNDTMPQVESLSMESSINSTQPLSTLDEEVEQDTQESLAEAFRVLQLDEEEEQEGLGESFHDIYALGKLLGEGGYGKVHQCRLKTDSDKVFAVKTVPIEKYDHREIEVLDALMECPNVTRVIDMFHDHDNGEVFIIMEEMKGGDLLDRLHNKGEPYTEEKAKALFKTLLETLQFCHSRGIAHLDIKLENILLRHKDDDTSMQLADFGLAKRFIGLDGRLVKLDESAGTLEYMAPEIVMLDGIDVLEYDERSDIWSCGVVLYTLLGGYQPFDSDDEDEEEMLCQICDGAFEFHRRYWENISAEAKDLISGMLQVDADERLSLEEALNSDWFAC